MQIDFSGGIRSRAAISQAFDAGADLLCVGSAAVLNPEEVCLWLEEYGPEKFILSADVRGRRLAISGWTEDTDLSIDSFVADWKEHQIFTFLCTAIQRDGMLAGPDFSLYSELGEAFPDHTFIVSGGVSSINDIRVLQDRGAKAVVIGRAIYEGKITLDQLRGVAC